MATDKETLNYMKHAVRPYIFTASISPASTASVIAALHIMRVLSQREPKRITLIGFQLVHQNLCQHIDQSKVINTYHPRAVKGHRKGTGLFRIDIYVIPFQSHKRETCFNLYTIFLVSTTDKSMRRQA